MFLCSSRLPSFHSGGPPLHGSQDQVTTGLVVALLSPIDSAADSRQAVGLDQSLKKMEIKWRAKILKVPGEQNVGQTEIVSGSFCRSRRRCADY